MKTASERPRMSDALHQFMKQLRRKRPRPEWRGKTPKQIANILANSIESYEFENDPDANSTERLQVADELRTGAANQSIADWMGYDFP